jgi:hypothetical protein
MYDVAVSACKFLVTHRQASEHYPQNWTILQDHSVRRCYRPLWEDCPPLLYDKNSNFQYKSIPALYCSLAVWKASCAPVYEPGRNC